MSQRDGRSVGELLLESEQVARGLLHEAPDLDGRAMVRTWGEVIDAAADFWAALPTRSPDVDRVELPGAPGVMAQLRQVAGSVHRQDRADSPSGQYDDSLRGIADNYVRAEGLVTKHGHTWHQSKEQRDDVQAARTRVMHTVYLSTHATTVALANNLREHDALHPDRSRTEHGYQVQVVADAHRRMSAAEHLAGSYVHSTYPEALAGQHRDGVDTARLSEAFSRWDVEAHRAVATTATPHTVSVIANQEAWNASSSQTLWRAAASVGQATGAQYRTRLSPAIDGMGREWDTSAETWATLIYARQARPPDALVAAGNELRAATRELVHDRVGQAHPDVLAVRADLGVVASALQRSLASSVDLAHTVRDAGANPDLRVSARGAHTILTALAKRGMSDRPEHEHPVVSLADVQANRAIPTPAPLHAHLRQVGDATVHASSRALSSSVGLLQTPTQQPPVSHGTPGHRPETEVHARASLAPPLGQGR